MLLDFFVAGGIAAAAATKGLSDRPLETFGCTPMFLGCYRNMGERRRAAEWREKSGEWRDADVHAEKKRTKKPSEQNSEGFGAADGT